MDPRGHFHLTDYLEKLLFNLINYMQIALVDYSTISTTKLKTICTMNALAGTHQTKIIKRTNESGKKEFSAPSDSPDEDYE